VDNRFVPSPGYPEMPFSRAIWISRGTKPWSPSPCTVGDSRTTTPRTPAARRRARFLRSGASHRPDHLGPDRSRRACAERSRGDHERPIRTGERRRQGVDRRAIGFGGFRIVREVVDEAEVDDAVGR
jgi:hypothetical protein